MSIVSQRASIITFLTQLSWIKREVKNMLNDETRIEGNLNKDIEELSSSQFYAPENQGVLKRSIKQLDEGNGQEHDLIESE